MSEEKDGQAAGAQQQQATQKARTSEGQTGTGASAGQQPQSDPQQGTQEDERTGEGTGARAGEYS